MRRCRPAAGLHPHPSAARIRPCGAVWPTVRYKPCAASGPGPAPSGSGSGPAPSGSGPGPSRVSSALSAGPACLPANRGPPTGPHLKPVPRVDVGPPVRQRGRQRGRRPGPRRLPAVDPAQPGREREMERGQRAREGEGGGERERGRKRGSGREKEDEGGSEGGRESTLHRKRPSSVIRVVRVIRVIRVIRVGPLLKFRTLRNPLTMLAPPTEAGRYRSRTVSGCGPALDASQYHAWRGAGPSRERAPGRLETGMPWPPGWAAGRPHWRRQAGAIRGARCGAGAFATGGAASRRPRGSGRASRVAEADTRSRRQPPLASASLRNKRALGDTGCKV